MKVDIPICALEPNKYVHKTQENPLLHFLISSDFEDLEI